ncbi:hypothetical protein [Actinokineospora sp. HUAS TT18]|uniref:hypothetical protein n=1 Tax=Actinokineospora sp. HUAS TT18 TaxID=3447451 RepID=UPI003F524ABA
MATDSRVHVEGVLKRLSDLGSALNPVNAVSTARAVLGAIASPPPGDPAGLESLASVFRTAAADIETIGLEVSKIGTDRLPEAWKDGAARDAVAVVGATARAVNRTPTTFQLAAAKLAGLAVEIRAQQTRWSQLRQALSDAVHDATHIGPVPMVDPTALKALAVAVARLITGCIEVYKAALGSADRAVGTFGDLKAQARAATAAQGGLSADDAVVLADKGFSPGADNGILNAAQLAKIGQLLGSMSPEDRARFEDLLARAGSDTERAWILKGLTAGHGVNELSGFADKIRGKDDQWLSDHLSLIDRGGADTQSRFGAPVKQFDQTTCGTTALIVARAETDPLYSLSLTEGDPQKFGERFADEQARMHDATNTVWPEAIGTSPMAMADWMSDNSGQPGVKYDWHPVDDTSQGGMTAAYRDVVTAVDAGRPVPLMVGGDDVTRHYVLAVGHSGGDLLIYDPGRGTTVRVPESDFMNGNLGRGGSGWNRVHGVVTPG